MIRRSIHINDNQFPTVTDGGVGNTSSVLAKSLTLGNDIGLEGILASELNKAFGLNPGFCLLFTSNNTGSLRSTALLELKFSSEWLDSLDTVLDDDFDIILARESETVLATDTSADGLTYATTIGAS